MRREQAKTEAEERDGRLWAEAAALVDANGEDTSAIKYLAREWG